jgi:hypothetical protein
VKLTAGRCNGFCSAYGGTAAVLDTDEKYDTVHRLIKKTDEQLGSSKGYVIGLRQSKLISKMNQLSQYKVPPRPLSILQPLSHEGSRPHFDLLGKRWTAPHRADRDYEFTIPYDISKDIYNMKLPSRH